MKKSILAMALVVCMILGCFPVAALAVEVACACTGTLAELSLVLPSEDEAPASFAATEDMLAFDCAQYHSQSGAHTLTGFSAAVTDANSQAVDPVSPGGTVFTLATGTYRAALTATVSGGGNDGEPISRIIRLKVTAPVTPETMTKQTITLDQPTAIDAEHVKSGDGDASKALYQFTAPKSGLYQITLNNGDITLDNSVGGCAVFDN